MIRIWNLFNALFSNIFNTIGIASLTKVATVVFPPILIPLLLNFFLNNWGPLKDFVQSFYNVIINRNNDEVLNLYYKIGNLLGSLLLSLSAKRRRLKKLK